MNIAYIYLYACNILHQHANHQCHHRILIGITIVLVGRLLRAIIIIIFQIVGTLVNIRIIMGILLTITRIIIIISITSLITIINLMIISFLFLLVSGLAATDFVSAM